MISLHGYTVLKKRILTCRLLHAILSCGARAQLTASGRRLFTYSFGGNESNVNLESTSLEG